MSGEEMDELRERLEGLEAQVEGMRKFLGASGAYLMAIQHYTDASLEALLTALTESAIGNSSAPPDRALIRRRFVQERRRLLLDVLPAIGRSNPDAEQSLRQLLTQMGILDQPS